MKNYTLGIYSKDNTTLRVPKDELKILGAEENKAIEFPALAVTSTDSPTKEVGVVIDWLEDENVFLVDFDKRKIFAYDLIDQAHKPEKIGVTLYINPATFEATTEKKAIMLGVFAGMKGDSVLFFLPNGL